MNGSSEKPAISTVRKYIGVASSSLSSCLGFVAAMLATATALNTETGNAAFAAPRSTRANNPIERSTYESTYCYTDEECDDGDICTEDACVTHSCVHRPIANCVLCDPTPVCPPLDVVFVMDTSGSMADEAAALCGDIAQVIADLSALGISVNPNFLGITDTPHGAFGCLTTDVVTMLGGEVPGDGAACAFPDGFSAYESWGPATAIVAERFPWNADALRVVVPISDEGPCNGSLPDGCNDPGDDRDSITNAIAVAEEHEVIVSPITGTSADACVITLATALADGTGGVTYQSTDPEADLADAIYNIVLEVCTPAPCDDGNPCTINDTCIDGLCVGDPPAAALIACAGDEDCPAGWFCNLEVGRPLEGYCDCLLPTPLCVEFDKVCYDEGETIDARLAIGLGSAVVTGGQFLLEYDPECVEFVSMGPCPDSIFITTIDSWVDEVAGRIWYAVLAFDPETQTMEGTTGPYDIACMEFTKLGNCAPCNVCLLDDNPHNTILTDDTGRRVVLENCICSEDVGTNRTLELTCPESVVVGADPGGLSATVTWDPVTVSSTCPGPVDLTCTATHSEGFPIDDLIAEGGMFPTGISTFECTATDLSLCENQATCAWTVEVLPTNRVDADVQLSPPVSAGPLERCIEFEFYANCVEPPVVTQRTIAFGRPYNLPGVARSVPLVIPAGRYACVSAWDPKHTTRSVADVEIVEDHWVAWLDGDPLLGGSWLVSGNVDGDHKIDVLDLAEVANARGRALDPNTPCGFEGIHPDINGDWIVDALDEALVLENLAVVDQEGCCPSQGPLEPPILEISIKELRQRGLGHLAGGDANGDGMLSIEDFLGPHPAPVPSALKHTRDQPVTRAP